MNKLVLIVIAGLLLAAYACSNNESSELERIDDSKKLLERGRSISQEMQGVLLSNVSNAMQNGGPAHAVAFCNSKAIPLTDSLSNIEGVKISRISNKNRNPNNKGTEQELELMDKFQQKKIKDTVLQWDNDSKFTYYSTIKTGMPACMKCHGNVDTDINTETLSVLDSLYPEDKARNYSLGDFRGLWKIEFEQ
jgi:hypothetical protein